MGANSVAPENTEGGGSFNLRIQSTNIRVLSPPRNDSHPMKAWMNHASAIEQLIEAIVRR